MKLVWYWFILLFSNMTLQAIALAASPYIAITYVVCIAFIFGAFWGDFYKWMLA